MYELALFAGGGGGLLASKLLGWTTIGAVEIEEYRRNILLQRQADGILEKFRIWDDIKTFDGKPWEGIPTIITGGFPCQDVSAAGKGLGICSGERSGLWKEFARIIKEVKPPFVFAENSPLLTTRGLDIILTDLTEMGYGVRWCVLGAWHVGGKHKRNRIWIFANAIRSSGEIQSCSRKIRRMGRFYKFFSQNGHWESALSTFRGMDNGMARNVDRTDAIRDGQVPQVAATAFLILSQGLI